MIQFTDLSQTLNL